ncbi:ABC transporter ATP-binding protein [Cellvibrio japonicus]|uniref:ABC-type dipeptide transporter n=1 Tax=Cellvibrio japonicus (strain Ueda107) TaxID=498211 RepID=B3PJD8_CELJU|nr:dipeptide ABC transporter ATP-binding protein [Cellvibrio japonicus]ACE85290.1 ABC transporter domain protein [Cellvibrio japonicus Ueda107]QEI12683.1 ABC transporter ATP-binding protein [Cellvibrio japonicus]QEI16257.1 ABC transporter ATP-binding protein [Cellvibrio japonicus]QEI19835.1 ABC transporter ATP-binding protein [Cellvibrio japonicus]
MSVSTPLLEIENLNIAFGNKAVVNNLSLQIAPGERLALVGESGSGKTITALSILRLAQQARVSGSIRLQGEELLDKSEAQIRQVRGADIAMVFQEPMSALNPLYTIGNQISESLILHENLTPRAAREKTIALLARTGIREPERRVDSYPHQLSGGQLQRAVIAMALACKPKLLIADEPTTALDMTVRARIVKLLLDLQQEDLERNRQAGKPGEGMSILLITHDLNLVRRFAQRVAVMEQGKLVETNTTEALFAAPRHPYTIKLLNSIPVRRIAPVTSAAPLLLETRNLRVEYPKKITGWRGLFRDERFVALQGASVSLRAGETIGVVGESGSGKSTLAQAILGLIRTQGGDLHVEGIACNRLPKRARRALSARLQVVFQDPFGSLSPRQTIEQIVGEGLHLHFPELSESEHYQRIVDVLRDVGLSESVLDRYPHEFSGGQRQRIAIARAIVLKPKILVLDEPTSALDVSIQNQVLELLVSLQKKYSLSYLLITHDLQVVNALAHRLYVLKDGVIVESGDTEAIIAQPQHTYTQSLIQASL